MAKGILISKVVYTALTQDSVLQSMVGNKVYPMLIPENGAVSFPYIVFSRTNLTPNYTKDGCYEDTVDVSIIVCSNKYLESCEIAQRVRDVLDMKCGIESGVQINEIRLKNITEATYQTVFIQTLVFGFKVDNYYEEPIITTTISPTPTATTTPNSDI